MESQFFLNGEGKNLSKIQNKQGSLLHKIGMICGIEDLTPTMLRQAAEIQIQRREDMRAKSKVLNNHSQDVGRIIYDKSGPVVRVEFVAHRDAIENPQKSSEPLTEFESEMQEDMEKMDKEDKKIRERNARSFLEAQKEKRSQNKVVGPRICVGQADRIFLQEFVFEEVFCSIYSYFPKGTFYLFYIELCIIPITIDR